MQLHLRVVPLIVQSVQDCEYDPLGSVVWQNDAELESLLHATSANPRGHMAIIHCPSVLMLEG